MNDTLTLANGLLGMLMWAVTFTDLVLAGIYLWILIIKKSDYHHRH